VAILPSGGAETGAVQAARREPREMDRPKVRIIEKIKIRENLRVNIVFKFLISNKISNSKIAILESQFFILVDNY